MELTFSNTPVLDVQSALLQLAEFYPTIPKIVPDGVYGSETSLSVQAFQREFGLNPTGQVDYETWRALFSAYHSRIRFRSPPEAICLFRKQSGCYDVSDTGETVAMIQIFLNALAKNSKNFTASAVDGIYQEETKGEIQKFQKICELEPTGSTDLIYLEPASSFLQILGITSYSIFLFLLFFTGLQVNPWRAVRFTIGQQAAEKIFY